MISKKRKTSCEEEEKVIQKKPHRIVGTPDYMAPEIINGTSTNNPTIDWWSLGCMLFEFICGLPPFNDETVEQIYDNIVNRRIPWDDIEIGRLVFCY
jgi:serine/threonine protein kinase